ncbi:NAD(P)/FAD-dependent oxidoreductase [Phenylobacterium sp.]|jgi:monoamine oxidase|uniref:flavin monoamine oxidase family protein n=1 Tax=Phenylobacterium sp. TaxID=1871053 RepID=UPI002E35296D|nr:NAD(P)/FAD-dependent oxidoreductase [Phenylobacterium sp.]HEX4710242.1 NAD(P)/FAD-dependent oxidoreductase [Phenylobacterium sp.]
MQDRFDVVVVGAGAAGIAALRRLAGASLSVVALEARSRVGGRTHTVLAGPDLPVDCGAGWVHSADKNLLAKPIEQAGFTIDRAPPHWTRQSLNRDFPPEDQRAFRAALNRFEDRLRAAAAAGIDRRGSDFLEPGGRWNVLIEAFSSYYNGAEFDQVSTIDFVAYEDSGVNWRVSEGYGAAIASFADMGRIIVHCPVATIRHDRRELTLDTAKGRVTARAIVVCVPTSTLADGRLTFSPSLPEKSEAAADLPLGLADKVFLGLDKPDDLPIDGHLFGHTDRTETGSYHLRPFGKPYIEAFLGGRCARELEAEGPGATTAFVVEELAALIGSDFRRNMRPLAETAWAADPWALGSYSHALPGRSGCRATLAAPVDDRIFFAGEATHPHFYSTVHGAWESGLRAADEAIAALDPDRLRSTRSEP